MLLYVFRDGTIRQSKDNPSVAEMLAVASGGLFILKFDGKNFLNLTEKGWIKVEDVGILTCSQGRIHQ